MAEFSCGFQRACSGLSATAGQDHASRPVCDILVGSGCQRSRPWLSCVASPSNVISLAKMSPKATVSSWACPPTQSHERRLQRISARRLRLTPCPWSGKLGFWNLCPLNCMVATSVNRNKQQQHYEANRQHHPGQATRDTLKFHQSAACQASFRFCFTGGKPFAPDQEKTPRGRPSLRVCCLLQSRIFGRKRTMKRHLFGKLLTWPAGRTEMGDGRRPRC